MSVSVDTSSAMVIRELTGQKREVILVERGLPFRPFELSTSQRAEATWYPGSPVATGSVYGGVEDPTTMNGIWNDRFLGADTIGTLNGITTFPIQLNGFPIPTAREAVTLFDSICLEGQLCLFTWDEDARRGLLKKVRKKWLNRRDCEWEMEWLWLDRGDDIPAAVVIEEQSLSDTASLFEQIVNTLLDVADALTLPLPNEFDADLTLLVQATAGAAAAVSGASAAVNGQAYVPQSGTLRACASMGTISKNSTAIGVLWNAQPSCTLNTITPAGDQTYSQRVVADSEKQAMLAATRQARRDAIAQRVQLLAQLQLGTLGTYLARFGDDLRDVSKLYYQTPDQWRALMLYNNLDTVELVPGQLIVIPKITTTSQQAP